MKNHKKELSISLIILMVTFLSIMSFTTIIGRASENTLDVRLRISENLSWDANGTVICNAIDKSAAPQIVTDGSGGAIIAWEDERNTEYDIYVQKIDSAGITKWDANGTIICNATIDQFYPTLVSDGEGGAIITWQDERDGSGLRDIYAQKINSAGVVQWTPNGVVVCNFTGSQREPKIVSDGAKGAIITWEDERAGVSNKNIYAQKINSTGVVQWTPNGIVICNATGNQENEQMVSDDSNGAIITWEDNRPGSTNQDIYAQKIDSEGITQWTTNGTVICNATNVQFTPQLVRAGLGGAIITFGWNTATNGYDIAAQKINSVGVTQWTTNGTIICNATSDQFGHQIVRDGGGGAIITWHDYRGANSDIYAQKIDSSGVTQWNSNGTIICNANLPQTNPKLISDNVGGAIISWIDSRGSSNDIYAQKINSVGTVQWTTNGIVVCNAVDDQYNIQLVGDGAEGAIITWQDPRMGASTDDIYAQKISDPYTGGGGGPIPGFDLAIIGLISAISVIILVKIHDRKKKLN